MVLKNKKSQVFTIIAVTFIAVMILFFFILKYNYPLTKHSLTTETRIKTMNSLLKDINSDINKALYIANFRSILAMENYIVSNGVYIKNLSSAYSEIMLNGTYNKTKLSVMLNCTINDYISRVKTKVYKTGILLNITVGEIVISQKSPWVIESRMRYNIKMTDFSNTATWSQTKTAYANISIVGFEDPLYPMNSFGRIANTIKKTPYENRYVIGNDTSNLLEHTKNGYYTESDSAPSFLMRLQGNLSASELGIESLVDLEKFSAEHIPIKTTSVVDYIYFSERLVQFYPISNMPSWFHLDNETTNGETHLEKYEVSGLIG